MGHFSIGKVFLVPSFDLEEKERRKIDRFLLFLDDSVVVYAALKRRCLLSFLRDETSRPHSSSEFNYVRRLIRQ